MIDLTDRVYVVTGATQGLGADIAERLVAAGGNVALVGRDIEKGALVEGRLGKRAKFVHADLGESGAPDRIVGETLSHFGRVDGLVNNACLYEDPGLSATQEQWQRVLGVNVVAAAILAARVSERISASSGVIVNIGSIGGKTGAVDRMLYPASKAALLQITKNLAVTLAPRGIRVLSVSPAVTWSPSVEMTTGTIEVADRRGAVLHPLGRIGRGEEVANVVAFACSDMASFVTGSDIAVDGGYTALGPDQGLGPRPWLGDTARRP